MDTLMFSSYFGTLSPESWIGFRAYKRHIGDTGEIASALVRRLLSDPHWGAKIEKYNLRTNHVHENKQPHLGWNTLPDRARLHGIDERNYALALGSGQIPAQYTAYIYFNTDGSVIRRKLDGKMRKIPEPTDSSMCSLHLPASDCDDPRIVEQFLSLASDWFVAFGGEHAWSCHGVLNFENGYDSSNRDFYTPTFITWSNWFDNAWVEKTGRARVLTAPAHEIRELANGAVMMTICANPMDQLGDAAQRTARAVKQHLGILSPSERDGRAPFAPTHISEAEQNKDVPPIIIYRGKRVQ